jgi:hypothetical protein
VTTDQLIAHYAATTTIPLKVLDQAIPAAIDTIYRARDEGRSMHEAGAAAAIVALETTHLYDR